MKKSLISMLVAVLAFANHVDSYAQTTGDVRDDSMLSFVNSLVEYRQFFAISIAAIIILLLVFGVAAFAFKLREVRIELTRAAYYDDITGLINLKKLMLDVRYLIETERDNSYAIVLLDIKNFSMFNEIHGREEGNDLLRTIGAGLGSRLIPNKEFIARSGSDEFTLFLLASNENEVVARATRALEHFQKELASRPQGRVKIVFGAYLMEEGDKDIQGAYEKAKLAHKIAKKSDSINYKVFDSNMKSQAQKEQHIENIMEEALLNHEFKLVLQPQYLTKTEEIYGMEALVRWKQKDGFIPPFEFLHIFERNGFIVKLDYYMFQQTCRLLRRWIDEGRKVVPISVNFSRKHLNNPNFVSDLCDMADLYHVPHELLSVELTENTFLESTMAELLDCITRLHENNFTISLDDFGSGYSSLGFLRALHVDTLKLDKSFFAIAENDDDDSDRMRIIVESIIRMAKNLGIDVVAEGVEDLALVEYLREIECDVIQGYYYSKPVFVGDAAEMIKPDKASGQ